MKINLLVCTIMSNLLHYMIHIMKRNGLVNISENMKHLYYAEMCVSNCSFLA